MLRRFGRTTLITARALQTRAWSATARWRYAAEWSALASRWPSLGRRAAWRSARSRLHPFHAAYVAGVSTPKMAMSLETAVLLHLLCVDARPRRLLDLGSGFSSFVLRRYAKETGAEVTSVDDNGDWLARTAAFLADHDLSSDRLRHWDAFVADPAPPYDLIFYDFSSMPVRRDNLPHALDWAAGGIVVLDDLHKAPYADAARGLIARRPDLRLLPARGHTADRLGRFAGVVVPSAPAA